jgi:hypothetical protein
VIYPVLGSEWNINSYFAMFVFNVNLLQVYIYIYIFAELLNSANVTKNMLIIYKSL